MLCTFLYNKYKTPRDMHVCHDVVSAQYIDRTNEDLTNLFNVDEHL